MPDPSRHLEDSSHQAEPAVPSRSLQAGGDADGNDSNERVDPNIVGDDDTVVAPHAGPQPEEPAHKDVSKNSVAASPPNRMVAPAVSEPSQTRGRNFIIMMIFAVFLAVCFWQSNQAHEAMFSQYLNQAELGEYANDYQKTSENLTKAIDTGVKLSLDRRQLADLYMRKAAALDKELTALNEMRPEYDAKEEQKAAMREKLGDVRQREVKALLAAQHLLEVTPHTDYLQMTTLEKLCLLMNTQVRCDDQSQYMAFEARNSEADIYQEPVFSEYPFITDAWFPVKTFSQPKLPANMSAEQLRNYLKTTGDFYNVEDRLRATIANCKTAADYEKIIPLSEEIAYHPEMGPQYFEKAEQNLDNVIRKARGSSRDAVELTLADEAYNRKDWRGAIVEYGRYLMWRRDAQVEARLLEARKNNLAQFPEADSRLPKEFIECLQKLNKLQRANPQYSPSMEMSDHVARFESLLDAYLDREDLAAADDEVSRSQKEEKSLTANTAWAAQVHCTLLLEMADLDMRRARYLDARGKVEDAFHNGKIHMPYADLLANLSSAAGRYADADAWIKKRAEPIGDGTFP